jgi:hypothetical protein
MSASGRHVIAVIGIDRYHHWRPLDNAVSDAMGAAAVFQRLGFAQITAPLLDDAATGSAIQSLVTDDLKQLGPDDSLVVFYAGHGGHQNRFSYANGIILTGIKLGVFESMLDAKGLQATHEELKLIYTWVVADADAMRDYLRVHLDGMIVNLGTVVQLKSILAEKEFLPLYELAHNGYNPWDAPTSPIYLAKIYTPKIDLAGTDATIEFLLKGTNGQLVTILNANYKGVLEQGTTTMLTFVGGNLGTITSLKLTALNSDINSDWLPSKMSLVSNKDANEYWFHFAPDEWLVKGSPLVKAAESGTPAV